MRSEKELRFTLLEREFDPTVVDNVLLELQTKGYIDDRKFAAAFIRDARLRKPAGTAMLFQKLRLKGIDRALIMEALDDLLPADTEQELAYTSAMKLLKRIRSSRKPVPPEKEKQRLSQYLAQRGFPWSTIRPALRKVFATNIESIPTDVEVH
jgi:regulatory protein